MNKYLVGALGAMIGALVVKAAYAKGRKEAYKELNDKIDLINEVYKNLHKKDEES